MGGLPRSRLVSHHNLEVSPADYATGASRPLQQWRPSASMIRAYYQLVLTVSAESIELALVRQGSGSARKKFESTLLRKRASPSRSHSGNNGPRVSLTCLWSVCFAQSNTMPLSFFASSGQKTDSITLLNCSTISLTGSTSELGARNAFQHSANLFLEKEGLLSGNDSLALAAGIEGYSPPRHEDRSGRQ